MIRHSLLLLVIAFGCSPSPETIEQKKAKFGSFENATLRWKSIDYTQTPIFKKISHHPEAFAYLDDVEIYSIAHLSDRLFITGFLVAPKAEGIYPVIVYNRGGNQDLGRLLVGSAVEVMAPIAANGYVVVATNYRGNSGAEGTEEFGGNDVNDVKNLISSTAEFQKADISRVGLLGISRGGMMNYLTIKDSSLSQVKAVATIGGITNLETTIQFHPEIEEVANELIPEFETNRKETIMARSAIYWTHQLPKNTPLLIMHSMEDAHVNYSQIPVFADSLEKNGVAFKMLSFEKDTHGLIEHQALVMDNIIKWFDTYVKTPNELENRSERILIP